MYAHQSTCNTAKTYENLKHERKQSRYFKVPGGSYFISADVKLVF